MVQAGMSTVLRAVLATQSEAVTDQNAGRKLFRDIKYALDRRK
jgi:hypothetical protein